MSGSTRETVSILGAISGSSGILLVLGSYMFPEYLHADVLPWLFMSFMWGAMTVILHLLWLNRPKQPPRPRRKTLDDMAEHVTQVEMPTEHTSLH